MKKRLLLVLPILLCLTGMVRAERKAEDWFAEGVSALKEGLHF